MKDSNDTIGNRTRGLPALSAVPQPTALPRAPLPPHTEDDGNKLKRESVSRSDDLVYVERLNACQLQRILIGLDVIAKRKICGAFTGHLLPLFNIKYTGGPPYPRVILCKIYRGYFKLRIIPNAVYNGI